MSAPELAEQALVERAKSDPEAFGQLYDIYFPRIYSYIYRRTRDQPVAEDLTSETFFKALRNIRQYRFQGLLSLPGYSASPPTWWQITTVGSGRRCPWQRAWTWPMPPRNQRRLPYGRTSRLS